MGSLSAFSGGLDVNLFGLPNLPLTEELTSVLAEGKGVRIERIISTGQTSNWYDQDESEFVALLSGTAIIEYADGSQVNLAPGDTLLIPGRQRHRVAYTSSSPPAIWLCVFALSDLIAR